MFSWQNPCALVEQGAFLMQVRWRCSALLGENIHTIFSIICRNSHDVTRLPAAETLSFAQVLFNPLLFLILRLELCLSGTNIS